MNIPVINISSKVSNIVKADYRTADVFHRYGIKYYMDDNISLFEVCLKNNLEADTIMAELRKATRNISISSNLEFEKWSIGFLIDYIVNVHHAYLNNALPALASDLKALDECHKGNFPEPGGATMIFDEMASTKFYHTRQEEEIIFPYMRQIENAYSRKETYGSLFVRTLRKPLHTIEPDHRKLNEILKELQKHITDYSGTASSCIRCQVIHHRLKDLEQDLAQHTYLEHNILFPRAMEMERALLQL